MGCLKLPYDQETEALEKSPLKILGAPEEKSCALKKCNDYMPFGGVFNSYTSGTKNNYLYQGKEEQEELDTYDFGLRMYDQWVVKTWQIDPGSETYYHASPYSWAGGNPIRIIDPTGAFLDDITAKRDGTIEVVETDDSFDRFFVENKDGSTTKVAQLDKATNENGDSMVKLPSEGKGFTNKSDPESSYVKSEVAAALFGAANQYSEETGLKVQFNQLNTFEGGHSSRASGFGHYADVRYANLGGNVDEAVWTTFSNFDQGNSQLLADKFSQFGFNKPGGQSILTENAAGNGPALKNTLFVPGHGKFQHKHHMHLQRFNYRNVIIK